MKDDRTNRQRTIDKIDAAIRFVRDDMFENARRVFGKCAYCRHYLNVNVADFVAIVESGNIPDDFKACHSCPVYRYYGKVCTKAKAYRDVIDALTVDDKINSLKALSTIRDDAERLTD